LDVVSKAKESWLDSQQMQGVFDEASREAVGSPSLLLYGYQKDEVAGL